MALNKAALSALIVANITALIDDAHLELDELQKFADAIADAVVTHIQEAAVVTVATTCSTGAGTGTGTVE